MMFLKIYKTIIHQKEKHSLIIHKQLIMFIKIYKTIIHQKVLIVSDDMIADMESNKKFSPIVTDLFLRRKKNLTSTCFYITILFKSS